MAQLIEFETHKDNRGTLTVIEKKIPFKIKRVFYIYNVDNSKRGFHKHKLTRQVAVCIKGSCDIIVKNVKETKYKLDKPEIGLIIEPNDFHWMENFSRNSILLILASETYNNNDYIYENSAS
tara:strand:+ start:5388 stop:5753 length:366 start_codon:yes stop_codon:yes gene_type:complete